MENILELQQVSKTYPKSDFILDNVTFSLPYGAVLGFVGGMQTSDIINSGDGSAIPTIKAASVRRGQQRINGKWYLFDNNGHYKTGFQWIPEQHKTVYYARNGQMQYGQQRINGHWYLLDNCTGAMKSGLQYIANQRKTVYYAGNGQMQYGYQTINGHHYYFNTSTGALEPLPSTGSSKTYAPSNQSTFSLNGHSYAVKSFSGTGTVPADNYVYAWTSLRNYYLFEYYGNAHKELASLHVGSPVVINGQTLHVREIITNVSNDGNAYDLVARKMQQYKAGWQTCEYAAYGSTLRLWFAN